MNYLLQSLKKSLLREKELARTDQLTEVANSRGFYEYASIELKRAKRYKRQISIAFMDIDNFKFINDKEGHSTGDSLLRIVAATLKNNIRLTDLVARMGGDEFAILLPETGQESVEAVLNRVHEKLITLLTNIGYHLTFSIGVIIYKNLPENVDEMIKNADSLMYEVKKEGKNNIKYLTY